MIPSNLRVMNFSSLVLEIHTIGYPLEGESIVIFLKDGDNVIFTLVTDCYRTECRDEIAQVFAEKGNPTIDVFVWTHPDEDHSVGIDTMLNAYDSAHQARVFMPIELTRDVLKNDCSKVVYDYLMRHYNNGCRYQLTPIGSFVGMPAPSIPFEIQERSTGRVITGAIRFLLPNSTLAVRREDSKVRNSGDMNDFSVVYVLELNGLRYFFGADMTKAGVKFLEGDNLMYLENIRYIKIPHHGSKEPKRLPAILRPFENRKVVATTTVFGTANPTNETLDRYAYLCSNISSTGRGDETYGRVRLDFSVTDMAVPDPLLYGNAAVVSCMAEIQESGVMQDDSDSVY